MEDQNSWSKTTRYIVLVFLLLALLWFIYSARALIGPLAISALIAYLLDPVVVYVSDNTKLSRPWVILLVYVVTIGSLVLAGILIAPFLPEQITGLADQLEAITLEFEKATSTPIIFLNFEIPLDRLLATWPEFSQNFTRPDLIIDVLSRTSANLIWILVVLVTTYYLLLDWVKFRDWLLGAIPNGYRPDAIRLYREVRQIWHRYFRGQLRLMIIVGVLTGISSAAIGLPGAFAFGVLAGVFDIVMSIGPLIVTFIAAIVALFLGSTSLPISNFWFMVLVITIYTVISLIENIWLRPKIMSGTLRVHPAIIFIAVIAALTLAGVLTALIIVPLISSILVISRYLYCKILDIPVWPDEDDHAREDGAKAAPASNH